MCRVVQLIELSITDIIVCTMASTLKLFAISSVAILFLVATDSVTGKPFGNEIERQFYDLYEKQGTMLSMKNNCHDDRLMRVYLYIGQSQYYYDREKGKLFMHENILMY